MVTVLVGTLFLLPALPASGQTPPAYPELFQDPPRTDQLTQADLSNLSRQVSLEATSMFVHVQADLADNPLSGRLLEDITAVWRAADAFTGAVTDDPSAPRRIDAGLLVFPDLDEAFNRLRANLGIFPGSSFRASQDLADMSRAFAVIGPLLRQNPPSELPDTTADQRAESLESIRELARELASLIPGLRSELGGASPAHSDLAARLDQSLEVLARLAGGLERIAAGPVDEREAVAAIRPLRDLAQRIDVEAKRGALPESALGRWSSIKQRTDDLATRFGLPREILPRGLRGITGIDLGPIAAIDEAARDIDAFVDRAPDATSARLPGGDLLRPDARQLQARLFLLRQYLLGRQPSSQVAQAIRDIDRARQRLEADAIAAPPDQRDSLARLLQKAEQAATQVRREAPHAP
jgi:hypothetical protein